MSSGYNTASSSSSTVSQFDIGTIIPGSNTRIVQLLGAGGFGRVFKAKNKFHILSAVKVNRNVTKKQQEENLHEASILKAIFISGKTDYLVKSNRQFAHGPEYVFQMELLDVSLLDFLMRRKGMGPLEIPTIVSLFTQPLKATVDLYDVGYIHVDIKLENILICKEAYKGMRIKLADYGLSTPKEQMGSYCGGTLMYMAPEMFLGLPVTEKIDSWSIGCVLFSLFTNYELFDGNDDFQVLGQISEVFGVPQEWFKGKYFNSYFWRNLRGDFRIRFSQKPPVPKSYVVNDEKQTLKQLLRLAEFEHEICAERNQISNFIEQLLNPIPSERMTPSEALEYWEFCLKNYCY